jgi:ATP adenylyltransferase
MAYVSSPDRNSCVLCIPDDRGNDVKDLVLHRGSSAYVILNLYPYNTGHLMVVPYTHAASLAEVDSDTRHEIFDLASLSMEVFRTVLRCAGFNMGMNIGEIAGAGVASHIHLHVVPRWVGDANFMPILGDTVVLPELLPVTYARLRAELDVTLAVRNHGAVAQAGAVTILRESRCVVLRRSSSGEIVLPKGDVESGETVVDAAMREVREATGVEAALAGWAGSSTFQTDGSDGGPESRFVSYVLGVGTDTNMLERHLRDDVLLVPIDDAPDTLTIPELSEMVRGLIPALRRLCEGMP